MIKLLAGSSDSFLWRPELGQWALLADPGGEPAAFVRATPFVIGRAHDCRLLLADSVELRKTTSRWHCAVIERDGRHLIVDGGLREHPDAAAAKPSVSGTWLNGRRISGPQELKDGDEIAVGPWRLRVEVCVEYLVNIDEVLTEIGSGQPRTFEVGDQRIHKGFARLQELSQKLNRSTNVEANLAALLNSAMTEIPSAGVVALLIDGAEGRCSARIAWQRGGGRVFDFYYSSDLVRRLPQDRSCLFESRIQDFTRSQRLANISSALLVPLWESDKRLGILYMDNRGTGTSFTEEDLCIAGALANHASLQLLMEKQTFLSRVESNMARYFDPDAVRLIVENARMGSEVVPDVRELTATILFVDMAGFSNFCQGRSPRQVSELLNPYFQLVVECIQSQSGHVDKFIGDGVLGVFGARSAGCAQSDGSYAAAAVRAARQMLALWAGRAGQLDWMFLPLRVGINTGPVVIGNVGFQGRMEYSVIGDAVNLASRMEKLAEPNSIALTDATRCLLADEFPCVDCGEKPVKGFGPVRLWRLGA